MRAEGKIYPHWMGGQYIPLCSRGPEGRPGTIGYRPKYPSWFPVSVDEPPTHRWTLTGKRMEPLSRQGGLPAPPASFALPVHPFLSFPPHDENGSSAETGEGDPRSEPGRWRCCREGCRNGRWNRSRRWGWKGCRNVSRDGSGDALEHIETGSRADAGRHRLCFCRIGTWCEARDIEADVELVVCGVIPMVHGYRLTLLPARARFPLILFLLPVPLPSMESPCTFTFHPPNIHGRPDATG